MRNGSRRITIQGGQCESFATLEQALASIKKETRRRPAATVPITKREGENFGQELIYRFIEVQPSLREQRPLAVPVFRLAAPTTTGN